MQIATLLAKHPDDAAYGNLPDVAIDSPGTLPYIDCRRGVTMRRTMRVPVRSKRLEIRATPEQKRLIERAARLRGTSVTDFVVNKLQEAALEIVEETESIRLREEDRKAFFKALIRPPAPTKYAKAAIARYKKQARA
jgi:uncharacterized protein (DUF1778 family)